MTPLEEKEVLRLSLLSAFVAEHSLALTPVKDQDHKSYWRCQKILCHDASLE